MAQLRSRAVCQRRAFAGRPERGIQPLQSLEVTAQLPILSELAAQTRADLWCGLKRPLQRAAEVVDFGVEHRQRALLIESRKARDGLLDELEVVLAVALVNGVPLPRG